MKPSRSAGWIVLAIAVVASGCFPNSQRPGLFPRPSKPRLEVLEAPKTGVELMAAANGNVVWATVINHTDRTILVGPKYFAVFVGGKAYPANPASVASRFPVKRLGREEGASGVFQFGQFTSLVGQQLVLNSPDAQPVKTKIRQRQAEVAAPRGTVGPLTPPGGWRPGLRRKPTPTPLPRGYRR